MIINYWLDLIEYMREIDFIIKFSQFAWNYTLKMIQNGTIIQIGDVNINEEFKKYHNKIKLKIIKKNPDLLSKI